MWAVQTIDSAQQERHMLWYYLECLFDSFPQSTEIKYNFSSVSLTVDDERQRNM